MNLMSAPFSWYETPDDVQRRLSRAWRARPDRHVPVRRVPERHRHQRRRNRNAAENLSWAERLALQKQHIP